MGKQPEQAVIPPESQQAGAECPICLDYYSLFQKQADGILKKGGQARYLVVYLDIHHFHSVNEYYGFVEGDRLLHAFAAFLKGVSNCAAMSRVFADNFVLLLEAWGDRTEIIGGLNRRFCAFLEEQSVHHPDCDLAICCGISPLNQGLEGLMPAVDNANYARKVAKGTNQTCCVWFTEQMEEQLHFEKELLYALQKALKKERFGFYLQPKVNLKTGKIVGAEALARWEKDGSSVPPDVFIPMMERNGSIMELDLLLYRKICAYMKSQKQKGLPMVPVSMNVSRAHLKSPGFAQRVHNIVTQYGVHPSLLEFELTETLFIENMDKMIGVIQELRDYGYKISVDDFGSGYSSLNLVQELNFDILKLDRKFIGTRSDSGDKKSMIVSSIAQMAQKLQVAVLCEGIETWEQAEYMQHLGCNVAQGYYFSPPLPPDSFSDLLKNARYYPLPWNQKQALHRSGEAPEYTEIAEMAESEIHAVTHSLFHVLPGGMAGFDLKGEDLLFVNDGLFKIMGYSREELQKSGDPIWYQRLFPAKLEPHELDRLAGELKESGKFQVDYTERKKDGSLVEIRLNGGYANSPEWGRYILCVYLDVTKEKAMQKEARASHRKMENLLSSLRGGIGQLVLTDRFRIIMASDGFYAMTGYTKEESVQPPFCNQCINLVLEEDRPFLQKAVEELLDGVRDHVEYRIRKKDGSIAWNASYISNIYEENGQMIGEAFFVDITTERAHAQKLHWEEKRFRYICEQLDDVVFDMDFTAGTAYYSPAFEKIFGFNPGDQPLMTLMSGSIVHPEDKSCVENSARLIFSGAEAAQCELRIKDRSGQFAKYRVRMRSCHDDKGKLVHGVGTIVCIESGVK